MKNIDLLERAILSDTKEASDSLIKQFLLSNQMQNSKFNIFDYCAKKDDYSPAFTGVLHEKGYKVATDGHCLIILKEDYPAELEGKIVDKKGAFIDSKFPDFSQLLQIDDKYTFYEFDGDKILEIEKDWKIEKKLNDFNFGYVKIQNTCLGIELLAKMVRFAKTIGTNQIGIQSPNRAVKIGKGLENCGIMMPVLISNESNAKEYTL